MSSGVPTPGSSSSSPVATGTTTTTTTTGTSSMSFSPPPASTFSPDPTPLPTFGPPNNNSPTSGISSSASLYLYTFLATLVLLLGVSSAIVARSLILRRRHRRMIEEAIRNGTWVPPAAASSRRVDLSKKPKMYEAWISHGNIQDNRGPEHADWEGIMPFSVLYTLSNKQAAGTPQASTFTDNTNNITPSSTSNTDTRTGAPGRSRLSRFASLSLFRQPVAPAASPSASPLANPAGSTTNNAAGDGNAAGNNGSSGSHSYEKQPVAQVDGRKSKVQVAVLIAMPNASHSGYYNIPSSQSIPPLPVSDASSTGSTQAPPQTPAPLLSTPLAATPPPSSSLPNTNTHYDGDEGELPPIEVGVAQVSILGDDDDVEMIDRTSSEAREAKRSIGSVSDHHQDSGSRSSDVV